MLPPIIHLPEIGDEILRALNRGWGSQTHVLSDNADEFIAVVQSGMPHRRAGLQLSDKRHDILVLGLVQIDTVAGGDILLLKVSITRSSFRRDWHQMPERPKLRSCARWMEASDFAFGDFATCVQPSMRQEGMTVAEGVPRAELDKIPIRGLLGRFAACSLVGFLLRRSRLLQLGSRFGRCAGVSCRDRVLRMSDWNGQSHREGKPTQAP